MAGGIASHTPALEMRSSLSAEPGTGDGNPRPTQRPPDRRWRASAVEDHRISRTPRQSHAGHVASLGDGFLWSLVPTRALGTGSFGPDTEPDRGVCPGEAVGGGTPSEVGQTFLSAIPLSGQRLRERDGAWVSPNTPVGGRASIGFGASRRPPKPAPQSPLSNAVRISRNHPTQPGPDRAGCRSEPYHHGVRQRRSQPRTSSA